MHTPTELLDRAVQDSIVILGIGGRVPCGRFKLVFKEIDAETFAKIMYATDQMMFDFEGSDAKDEKNILPTIDRHDFEYREHFNQVADIFRKYFGSETLRFE